MAGTTGTTAILLLIFLPTISLLAYLLHASTASLRSLNHLREHEVFHRYHHHGEYNRHVEEDADDRYWQRQSIMEQREKEQRMKWLEVQRKKKQELSELQWEIDSARSRGRNSRSNNHEPWWKAYGLQVDPENRAADIDDAVSARSTKAKCDSCAPPPPVSWDEVLPPPQPRLTVPKANPVLQFALAPLPPDDQNAFSFFDKLPTSDASLLATYSLLLHCLPLPATRELLMPPQWQQLYFNCIQKELKQGIDRLSCDRCEQLVPSTMQRAAKNWCSAQQLYRSEAFARLSNRTMYQADLFPTLPVFRQTPAYLRSVLDLSAPAYLKLEFTDFRPPRVQVSGEWSRITDPMAVMVEKLLELFRFTPHADEERFSWKQFRRQDSFHLLPHWMQTLVLRGTKFSITLRAEKYLFAPLPLPMIIVDEVINKMFHTARTDCSIWAPNDPHCRWEEFFHPDHGSLRSRLTGLLLVDGFSFDLRVDASAVEAFSLEEVQALKSLRVGDLFLDLMREHQSYSNHIASKSNWGRIWTQGELKRKKQKAKENAKEEIMWHTDFDFDFEEDAEMELSDSIMHDDCCDQGHSSQVGVFKLKVPRGKPFLLANLFDHVLHQDGLVITNRTTGGRASNVPPQPIPMQIHLFSGHATRQPSSSVAHETQITDQAATDTTARSTHEDVPSPATTPAPHEVVDPKAKVLSPTASSPSVIHSPDPHDSAAFSQFAYTHSDSHSAESHSSAVSAESSPHHSFMHSEVESHESQEAHDDALWLQSILAN